MQPQSPMGIRAEFDVPVTMRDGVVLRANVYRPDDDGAGTYPVLLSRLPYGKDLPLGSTPLDPSQAARRGYIVVVQDVRGTFTSAGEWFPLIHEAEDGADTVAWAAALPGSNGTVGMYGGSYVGFTQWAAATQNPPALRALAPMITWADSDEATPESATRNGVLELGVQAGWNLELGLDQISRRHRGDLPMLGPAMARLVHEINTLPRTGFHELPLQAFGPLARHGLDGPLTSAIEQGADSPMAQRALMSNAYAMGLPALHFGGWYDAFIHGTLRNFTRMQARGHTNQWLVIGPWTHGVVGRVQGDLDFGYASSGGLIDLRTDIVQLHLQFFDHVLKGVANGFDSRPRVSYFVMGANVWKSSDTWPPTDTTPQAWYLQSAGHANSDRGDGVLSPQSPEGASTDHYTYDPAVPVPTVGGATMLPPILRAGPRDQRSIEQRADVLVYTSALLTEAVEVAGEVSVELYVATDAPDTDFVARLVDVHPDGMAITVADGITRMRFRNGVYAEAPDAQAQPLDPETVYHISIDLWSTAIVFLPGHRIRVDVTSSSFPRWERNLNTGANNATTTAMRPAQQTLMHDAAHPSHILLPVRG